MADDSDAPNPADYPYSSGFDAGTGTLHLYFKEEMFEPGTPTLIKWDKPENYRPYDGTNAEDCDDFVSPVFKKKLITKTLHPVTSADAAVVFCGTYDSRYFPAANRSLLFLGAENTLHYPQTGARIGPARAWFQLSGITAGDLQANAVRLFFGNASAEDGIVPVTGEATAQPEIWFSIGGLRLSGRPAAPGLYINNGRKVAIK